MSKMPDNASLEKLTLWTISIPIFVEFLLTFSVFFTDTFFLSRISDMAAASVGAIIPIFMIFVLLLMMLAQGGGGVAAQFLGAGKTQEALYTYQSSLIINGAVGVLVSVLLYFLSSDLGIAFGMPSEATNYVSTYLLYLSPAMFFIAVKTAYNAVVFSQGKTQWNMYAAVLVNFSNILCNSLFVLGVFGFPKLGVAGVAVSTLVSQVLAVIFLSNTVRFNFGIKYRFDKFFDHFKKYSKPILQIGIPAAIEPVSSELGMMVLSVFIVHLGTVEMATRTYTMNLLVFAMCWSSSLALGNQILIAHRVGAGQFSAAHRLLKKNILCTCLSSFLILFVVSVFARQLLGIFTNNDEVINLGISALLLGLLIEPSRAVGSVASYALKGVGDAKFPTLAAVIITWAIVIPFAYYLGFVMKFGFIGVWFGLLVDEFLRAVVNYWRWAKKKWMTTGVIQQESFSETLSTTE